MIHPSYTELMTVVNGDNEEIDKPVVQSRYSIVLAAAKRARQIIDGAETSVVGAESKKPLSIAVEEIYERKIEILPNEDDFDDDEEEVVEDAAEELVEE